MAYQAVAMAAPRGAEDLLEVRRVNVVNVPYERPLSCWHGSALPRQLQLCVELALCFGAQDDTVNR